MKREDSCQRCEGVIENCDGGDCDGTGKFQWHLVEAGLLLIAPGQLHEWADKLDRGLSSAVADYMRSFVTSPRIEAECRAAPITGETSRDVAP